MNWLLTNGYLKLSLRSIFLFLWIVRIPAFVNRQSKIVNHNVGLDFK